MEKFDATNRVYGKKHSREIPLVHYHVTAASVRDFDDAFSDEESQPPRRYTNYYYKLLMPARAAGQTDLAPISRARDACCASSDSDRANGNAPATGMHSCRGSRVRCRRIGTCPRGIWRNEISYEIAWLNFYLNITFLFFYIR